MENKYQSRIRELVEEMAMQDVQPHVYEQRHTRESYHRAFEAFVSANMAKACIAVKHMALMYEEGYFSNFAGFEDSEDYNIWMANCISEMEDKGLIPPPETNIENGK